MNTKIISVRDCPEKKQLFIDYFIKCWASEKTKNIYIDCIDHCINTESLLPQWYLLIDKSETIVGGVGLVTNDFISRMDLFPWLCALHVEEQSRNNGYGRLLIKHVCSKAANLGYDNLYLCTDHVGYYEKSGFSKIGVGFHPWGESSSIFGKRISRR